MGIGVKNLSLSVGQVCSWNKLCSVCSWEGADVLPDPLVSFSPGLHNSACRIDSGGDRTGCYEIPEHW